MADSGMKQQTFAGAETLANYLVDAADKTRGKFIIAAYGEPPGSPGQKITEVRHVANSTKAAQKIVAAIAELSGIPGANVYIMPALMRHDLEEGRKGGIADVVGMLAILADLDRHEGAAIDWRSRSPIEPHLVVETSPGNFQTWHFLDKPCSPAEVRPVLEVLIVESGADPSGAEPSHVFRAPDCWNFPNSAKIKEGRAKEPYRSHVVYDADLGFVPINPAMVRESIEVKWPGAFKRHEETRTKGREYAKGKQTPVSLNGLIAPLSYVDPGCDRAEWIKVLAAIRATDLTGVEDAETTLLEIAEAWSRGDYDREKRGKPDNYDADDVERQFDTLPPRDGGVGYGSIMLWARQNGYEGPPAPKTCEETFGDAAEKLKEEAKAEGKPEDDGKPKSPFLMTIADLRKMPKPEPLIEGFIMRRENICLYGPPKVGKSFVALDVALSIATGLPVFGKLATKHTGNVVYLSGEGHGGFSARIAAWCHARNIKRDDNLPFFYKAGVPQTANGVAEAMTYLEGIHSQLKDAPQIIVIDTMARSMSGMDENSSGDAGKYLDMTEALRVGINGGTVISIAHSGKDPTRGIRGSTALAAGLDAVWFCEKNEENGTVKMSAQYLKDAENLGPFHFRLRHVEDSAVLDFVMPTDPSVKKKTTKRDLQREHVYKLLMEAQAFGWEHGIETEALARRHAGPEPRGDDYSKEHKEWRTRMLAFKEHLENGARPRSGGKGQPETPAIYEGYTGKHSRPSATALIRFWYLPESARDQDSTGEPAGEPLEDQEPAKF
jgi:hypothetical protein